MSVDETDDVVELAVDCCEELGHDPLQAKIIIDRTEIIYSFEMTLKSPFPPRT